MKYRELGRTGWKISEVSFGAWGIGGDVWGQTDDKESLRALNRAVDLGVNFIDTADVYGDGRSERLIGQLRSERREEIIVGTKSGRRLKEQVASGYNRENLTAFVERSLKNLGTETIDVLQLHCPPMEVYKTPDVFGILDDLVRDGKLRFYGVSVERVDEALAAIEHPGVQSVQIIFNMFRHKPADAFFAVAAAKKVGILARLPLASGLLSGKLTANTVFGADDHRSFNRQGESWDKGETFSGVDYAIGLQAVEQLRSLVPKNATMAQLALRWILMFPEVTATIPGAKSEKQIEDNARAAELPPLTDDEMALVRAVYDEHFRNTTHAQW